MHLARLRPIAARIKGITRSNVNIAIELDADIYNTSGAKVQRSYLIASGSTISWTQSVYDDQGRVIQTIQSDGRTSETLYNDQGQVDITTDLHARRVRAS